MLKINKRHEWIYVEESLDSELVCSDIDDGPTPVSYKIIYNKKKDEWIESGCEPREHKEIYSAIRLIKIGPILRVKKVKLLTQGIYRVFDDFMIWIQDFNTL